MSKQGVQRSYDNYKIELLQKDGIPAFMDFIARNLNPQHLLANNRPYLMRQFYDAHRKSFNILTACETKTGRIIGILAFVDASYYDNQIGDKDNFLWLTNWLVEKNSFPMVGLHLLEQAEAQRPFACCGTVGNNETAGLIYRKLGYRQGGFLHQYYMQNPFLQDYALITHPCKQQVGLAGGDCVLEQAGFGDIEQAVHKNTGLPYKSAGYFWNKYIRKPYYAYQIWGAKKAGQTESIFVLKQERHQGACALRIVDFAGIASSIGQLKGAFEKLLKETGAEYIDFYNYGIETQYFTQAGFLENDMKGPLIVPCYYEPFLNENIPIRFAYKMGENIPVYIFKGDCDREFPRILTKDKH